jgi:hypothetical protein
MNWGHRGGDSRGGYCVAGEWGCGGVVRELRYWWESLGREVGRRRC